jgi:hypothetical protein
MSAKITDKLIIVFINALLLSGGCDQPSAQSESVDKSLEVSTTVTIGELGEIFYPQPTAVEGYSLIVNLNGTGSSQCPPAIRKYIEQYLLKQMPARTNVGAIIDSPDTAVVRISGTIPANASKDDYFDLKVEALSTTQTTSLEDGILLQSELKTRGQFGPGTKTLAMAEGPVYIDRLGEKNIEPRTGLILAGGRVLNDSLIYFVVNKKNFRLTKQICDRINEQFGPLTAKAVVETQIILTTPEQYKKQESKFFSLINSTYLFPSAQEKKMGELLTQLSSGANKQAAEISLEAIGITAAAKLSALLDSPDQEVRLRAARCLLNMRDDRGLDGLRKIVFDKSSKYRMEAIEAVSYGAKRNDASAILHRLLQDEDVNTVLPAYKQLSRLKDTAISRQVVGQKFFLDIAGQPPKQYVYVTRSGPPVIVLFGPAILCRLGTFVQLPDGSITINAPENLNNVQVIRQLSNKQPAKMESRYNLTDVLQTLGEPSNSLQRPGLNVSYDEVIAIIKELSNKQAIPAQFIAGPLAKID